MQQQGHGHVREDYEGLQVVEGNTGLYVDPRNLESQYPEHVPNYPPQTASDHYPETVPNFPPEVAYVPYKHDNYQQTEPPPDVAPPAPAPKKWWKRPWVLLAIAAAVILIAVVVGCVVGLIVVPNKNKASSSTDGSGNTTTSGGGIKSACQGTVCSQILTADTINNPASVFLFGRGVDNAIWCASAEVDATAESLASTWESLGGPFLSQPSAMTWNKSKELSVYAIADPDYSVRTRMYSSATKSWATGWINLKGQSISAAALCTINDTRVDLWINQPGKTTTGHNYWSSTSDNYTIPFSESTWQGSREFGDQLVGAPAIACRTNQAQHNLIVYDSTDRSARHSIWSRSTDWTAPNKFGANFVGDPVIVTTSAERIDFFGIGNDSAMYHLQWTSTNGHGQLENLGGKFESVPSVVVTGTDRLDVVALSTNDTIQHRVLQGTTWQSDWEDLGVFGNSAPLAVNLDSDSARVGLFVLGYDGEVNHTIWTVSTSTSWQGLNWSSMGGNLTSDWIKP